MTPKGDKSKSPFLSSAYDPDDEGCSWESMYELMRCDAGEECV